MRALEWSYGASAGNYGDSAYLKTLAEQAHKPVPEQELTKAKATAKTSELIDKLRDKAGLD